jgi:Flp pilus assembly pilin Flp
MPKGTRARPSQVVQSLKSFWKDERGQDLIEYSLMAALIAVVVGVTMPEAAARIQSIHQKLAAVVGRFAN